MTTPPVLPRNTQRAARLRRKIATVAMGLLALGLLTGVGAAARHSPTGLTQRQADAAAVTNPGSPDGSGWN